MSHPSEINQLFPRPLWQWFEQICAIPHPSKHEQALSEFIQNWAKNQGIAVQVDHVGNLILRKPATKGLENRKTVCLQAHLDMVPQKNADKQHDFTRDPIEPRIDGDWVKANNTTLGADNGIGMASALAILGSQDIPHGPLEVLLTVDEEAGMTGAFGLQAGQLQADILINTDSEQEGEIYMGCAGGVDALINLPISWEKLPANLQFHRIKISGLKGGHSGVNIHLGRANANKLLARFLASQASALDLQLVSIEGGTLRNAIPREANCVLACSGDKLPALQQAISEFETLCQREYAAVEPTLRIQLETAASAELGLSRQTQAQLIHVLNSCPNGVMRMSDEISGVTETSLNLGVIKMEAQHVSIICLIRSLIDSGRRYVESQLHSLASLAGASIEFAGAYPGWKPDMQSEVMAIVRDTYHQIYQKDPVIMVIHAGLECGLFKENYPAMDMVSIGPTIRYPHSPEEMVNITTVGQYWTLLLALLERIPAK